MSALQSGAAMLDALVNLEKVRADELIRLKKELLDCQLEYETKKMELLKQNKESCAWIKESRNDLRKELIAFAKKAVPEIHAELTEGNLPEPLINSWLEEIARIYLNDISLSLKMIAVDADETVQNTFKEITAAYQRQFTEMSEKTSAHIREIIDKHVDKEIMEITSRQNADKEDR
jgi:hypothetical protein